MHITYYVDSYRVLEDNTTTDGDMHAVTGDGFIAYALFEDLMKDNPDRRYTITAYIPFDGDVEESESILRLTEDSTALELVASVSGRYGDEELDLWYMDENPSHVEVLESLGLST